MNQDRTSSSSCYNCNTNNSDANDAEIEAIAASICEGMNVDEENDLSLTSSSSSSSSATAMATSVSASKSSYVNGKVSSPSTMKSGKYSSSSSNSNDGTMAEYKKTRIQEKGNLLGIIDDDIWISVIAGYLSCFDILFRLSLVNKSLLDLARKLPLRIGIPLNLRAGQHIRYNISASKYKNVVSIQYLGGNHSAIRTGVSITETVSLCLMGNGLKELDLAFTDIVDQDLIEISKCNTRLEKLVIQGCFRITNPAPISKLKYLEYLDVAFTQIPDVMMLLIDGHNSLPVLKKLNIAYCHRIENLHSLTSKSLDTLWMSHCINIQNFDISGLVNLRVLELSNCPFPYSIAKSLPHNCLEILEISHNAHVNSYDLATLPRSLKTFAIGPECLRKLDLLELNTTNVTTLYITGPRMVNISENAFPSKVTDLYLINCEFQFDNTIKLRVMDLSNCTGTFNFQS